MCGAEFQVFAIKSSLHIKSASRPVGVSNLSWPESLSKKSWVMTYYKILSAVQLGAGINRLEERRG